jgi:hypothetical protein
VVEHRAEATVSARSIELPATATTAPAVEVGACEEVNRPTVAKPAGRPLGSAAAMLKADPRRAAVSRRGRSLGGGEATATAPEEVFVTFDAGKPA